MRLIKMFGLAALAAMAAMALVGATSASAFKATQLCSVHASLTCAAGNAVTSVHSVLAAGTIGQLLGAIDILCLGFLIEATALGLAGAQEIHSLSQSFTGCGTGSAHSNCTVSIPAGQQPLFNLLKMGLDEGTMYAEKGQLQFKCSNIGLDCLYDLVGMEFDVGGGHLTTGETTITELGDKVLCPDEALLDALMETLGSMYVLG
jgi:hypothetical protein